MNKAILQRYDEAFLRDIVNSLDWNSIFKRYYILDILLGKLADKNRVRIVNNRESPVKVEDLTRLLAVTVALEDHLFFENLNERNVRFLRVEDNDVVGLKCGEVNCVLEFSPEDFSKLGSAAIFGGEDDKEI